MANSLALRGLATEISTLKNARIDFVLHQKVAELTNTFYDFLATHAVRDYESPSKVFTLHDHGAEVAFITRRRSGPEKRNSDYDSKREEIGGNTQRKPINQLHGSNSRAVWRGARNPPTAVSEEVSETNDILRILGVREIDSNEMNEMTAHGHTSVSTHDALESVAAPIQLLGGAGQDPAPSNPQLTRMHDNRVLFADKHSQALQNDQTALESAYSWIGDDPNCTDQESEEATSRSQQHPQEASRAPPLQSRFRQKRGLRFGLADLFSLPVSSARVEDPFSTPASFEGTAATLLQSSIRLGAAARMKRRPPYEILVFAKKLQTYAELLHKTSS